ncbi:MAG: HD domain-containing protein [Methanoregula sp.]|jgi:uncharacterized protein
MPDTTTTYSSFLRRAGCDAKVIAHCSAVARCAAEYARSNPDVDEALVEKGAWLHDIGRATTHSIHHAQAGADLLRARGEPEAVARIVECHTGAGLTADECTLLGLLPRDCIPRTPEEKIVAHADNLIAGKKRVTIEECIADAFYLQRKFRKRMYRLARDVDLLSA